MLDLLYAPTLGGREFVKEACCTHWTLQDGVGIGTLSPAFTLDVSGGVGAARGHPIQHSPVSQQGFAFTGSPSTGLFIAPDGERP